MSKLSDEQKAEVVKRHQAGEGSTTLAKECNVSATTILKYVRDAAENAGVKASEDFELTPSEAKDFGKRVRQILWKKEHGQKEKKSYTRWSSMVKEYRKHGGLSYGQAILDAAREFPCLEELIQEYYGVIDDTDLPDRRVSTNKPQNEERELTHRENLHWAIDAAGKFQRTGESPVSAPNDSAFYLYRLAIDDAKDFLSRFHQIETRSDNEQEEQRQMRKSGQRAISEINRMLDTLKTEES